MLEAKAKDQGHKAKCSPKKKKKGLRKNFSGNLQKKTKIKVFTKIFQAISKKKKVFTKIFQAISTKKRFPKNFSSAPQNFNIPKNSAVLEPRTGQFSRTWGLEAKAKDFKMCPRGQGRPRGLHLWLIQYSITIFTNLLFFVRLFQQMEICKDDHSGLPQAYLQMRREVDCPLPG